MKITNKFNLPEPVYKALIADNYSRGESNRSVTQLIDSPRKRILCAEYDDQIEEDASDLVWRVFGTAVHHIFEEQASGAYTPEERLFAEVDGWVISGAIDIQKDEGNAHVTLSDYKTTSVWSVIFGKKEWHNQLNFYAWLVEQARPVTVKALKVVAVLRDWKKREAEKDPKNYPAAPIIVVDIPLWTEGERDNYVRERVRIHQDAEFDRLTGADLPFCTPEERWVRPSKVAVMKGKNKRAVRVFDSKEDAEQLVADSDPADKLWVEERVGEAVRCAQGYCGAAPWCNQYLSELEQKDAVE